MMPGTREQTPPTAANSSIDLPPGFEKRSTPGTPHLTGCVPNGERPPQEDGVSNFLFIVFHFRRGLVSPRSMRCIGVCPWNASLACHSHVPTSFLIGGISPEFGFFSETIRRPPSRERACASAGSFEGSVAKTAILRFDSSRWSDTERRPPSGCPASEWDLVRYRRLRGAVPGELRVVSSGQS